MMRALLLVAPATLVAALVTGCFNLKNDDASFCQTLDCAVFASSSLGSDATGTGTQEKPFATIAKAAQAARGAPVYACGETFTGAVSLTAGAVIYGGYDCKAGWEHRTDAPTTLTAGPGEIPLRIAVGIDVTILDTSIRAADAVTAGGSSIAVVAGEGATVSFERCLIDSGAGAAAEDPAAEPTAESGSPGEDGLDACSAATVPGGAAPEATCGAGAGGKGADGDSAAPGDSGLPATQKNGGASETDIDVCTAGATGTNGTDGADGAPPAKTDVGTLDAKLGFVGPADGTAGASGTPGNGGGGGGASRGGAGATKCADAAKAGGASGGSGGSGGCGGVGGKGGAAGGSSIAIVSLGAQLAFKDVTIQTAGGGKGGDGAPGQAGGAGGDGGKGGLASAADLHPACDGGSGGKGGKGGSGGGGRGGHSIGIAYQGTAPTVPVHSVLGGAAGAGGKGASAQTAAPGGIAAETMAF